MKERKMKKSFLLLVLVCVLGIDSKEQCSGILHTADELKRCQCERVNKTITVYCVDQQFTHDESVRVLDMSNSTELLDTMVKLVFTGNTLDAMPPNILGNQKHNSFWSLKEIDFSNNGISLISGKTFHCAPELDTLILDDNEWFVHDNAPRIFSSFFELKKLHLNNAFSSRPDTKVELQVGMLQVIFEGSELYWLEELQLERNKLEWVNGSIFQALSSLSKLSLRDNQLKSIDRLWNSMCHEATYFNERYEKTCVLQELDLSNNIIEIIPKSLLDELDKMPTFKQLNLNGNKLSCDVRMTDFFNWLAINHDKIVEIDNLACHGPKSMKATKVLEVAIHELPPYEENVAGATVALAVILSLMSVALIGVLIYQRRFVIETTGKIIGSVRDHTCPRYKYKPVAI